MVEQGPQCRRCKADLSLLFAVEQQARALREEALQVAAQGRDDEALRIAERAASLHHSTEESQLLALLYLRQRDFARAWQEYQASAGNVGESA
jgi:hypothetical protein